MNAVVVYESMYGNTHHIASAIAEGLEPDFTVTVVPVERAELDLLETADLVVVGGPTHAHGMSRSSTRQAAVDAAKEPSSDLSVEPDAEGPGLREWFDQVGRIRAPAAAFDTRVDMSPVLTGRASKGIARKLRHAGATLVVEPESFLVSKDNHLEDDEEQRARVWGIQLAVAASKIG
ncbi:MAG: flavodoxin family protein [Acidimicrobiia bacterium]